MLEVGSEMALEVGSEMALEVGLGRRPTGLADGYLKRMCKLAIHQVSS